MTNDKVDRTAGLAAIVHMLGGTSQASKILGYSTPSFISQMLNGKRPISEKTAFRIEVALGLPLGWMGTDEYGDHLGNLLERQSRSTKPNWFAQSRADEILPIPEQRAAPKPKNADHEHLSTLIHASSYLPPSRAERGADSQLGDATGQRTVRPQSRNAEDVVKASVQASEMVRKGMAFRTDVPEWRASGVTRLVTYFLAQGIPVDPQALSLIFDLVSEGADLL